MSQLEAAEAARELQTRIQYPEWLRGIAIEQKGSTGWIVVVFVADKVSLPDIPEHIGGIPILVQRQIGEARAGG